jgi:hypothetical protein
MFHVFKKAAVNAPQVEPVAAAAGQPDLRAAVHSISQQAATMGREAAEVRGQLDDARPRPWRRWPTSSRTSPRRSTTSAP